jgi:hypothetical protein
MNNNNNVSKKRKKMHPITVDNENNGAVVTTADLVLPSENGNGYKAKKRQRTTEEYEKLWDGFSSSGGSTHRWKQISELQFNSNISAALIQRQWNSVSFHKWASSNKDAEPKAVLKAVRNAETDRERSLPSSSSFVPIKQFCEYCTIELSTKKYTLPICVDTKACGKRQKMRKAENVDDDDDDDDDECHPDQTPSSEYINRPSSWMETPNVKVKAENVDDDDGDDDDDDDECHPDQTPSSEYINRPSSWMETPNVKVKEEDDDDDDGDDGGDSSEYINRPTNWAPSVTSMIKVEE